MQLMLYIIEKFQRRASARFALLSRRSQIISYITDQEILIEIYDLNI